MKPLFDRFLGWLHANQYDELVAIILFAALTLGVIGGVLYVAFNLMVLS